MDRGLEVPEWGHSWPPRAGWAIGAFVIHGVQEATAGIQHLKDLQQAGLTHVHLLPSYDYGSVPERAEDQHVVEVCTPAQLSAGNVY